MGVGFKKREPIKPSRVYDNPKILEIFQKCNWLGYFERLRGYDDEVAMEFSLNFQNIQEKEYVATMRGLIIRINEASIKKVSSLPMGLLGIKRRGKKSINAKNEFFLPNEKPDEDKNGIKRESLPHPWPEVAYHIIKYITCEGIMSVVYSYHFRLLHQLRHLSNQEPHKNLSIPYFLLQSLKEMSLKVQKGKQDFLAHHGLIKLIVSDALRSLKHNILWEYFINMDLQAFEEAQETMSEEDRKKGEEPKRITRPKISKQKRRRKRKNR
jgi:hypothetical protein